MITGHRYQFEQRCRERGYTLDEVRACIVSEDGDTVTHVAAGMPRASEEEVARRFAICQGCEFFDGKACTKCGCPVVREKQFVSKLSWANERCPAGKWGPVS